MKSYLFNNSKFGNFHLRNLIEIQPMLFEINN